MRSGCDSGFRVGHARLRVAAAPRALDENQPCIGRLLRVDGSKQDHFACAPRADQVATEIEVARRLDTLCCVHGAVALRISGLSSSARTYAASRARVWAGMSVNTDDAMPEAIAALTSLRNARSSASRTAMSRYSLPLEATVWVTPRLARMLYDVRSPCLRPRKVTTGTPMSRASSVLLTPP